MCDALSRNTPKLSEDGELLQANCLAHGRRQFVEITANFPEECRYVLEALGAVYRNDAIAREQELSPDQRLRLHQAQSRPIVDKLHGWMETQLAEKKAESNSGLGKAFQYILRHWKALRQFLRSPGAPLDNKICERALKKAILHRKNSLFYKTLHGAQVGDLYMSLIQTCELNGANSFDYLTELQRHAGELQQAPTAWMPWNYRISSLTRKGPPRRLMMTARHGRKGLSSAMRRVFGEMPAKQGSGVKRSGRASGQGQKSSNMVRVDLYTRILASPCPTAERFPAANRTGPAWNRRAH
jgi:hypothetical protein